MLAGGVPIHEDTTWDPVIASIASRDLTIARRSSGFWVLSLCDLSFPSLKKGTVECVRPNPSYSGGTATDFHRSSLTLAT